LPKHKKKGPAEMQALRHAAGLYYTLQPGAVSLEAMRLEPHFRDIPLATLQSWQVKDEWMQRREAHLDALRQSLSEKLGDELLQARFAQISDFNRVYGVALDMLQDDRLQPKSWEGVARVMVSMAQGMDQYRIGAAQTLLGTRRSGGEVLPTTSIPELSHEEARAAAAAIVTMRRTPAVGPRRRLGQGRERALCATEPGR
jgi:hypothetical protein